MIETLLADFTVSGRPRTKGSLKAWCTKGPAHKIHVEEEVADSKSWRALVAGECRRVQVNTHGHLLKYPGPVEVILLFTFRPEQSISGGTVPSQDTVWPTDIMIGDVDKLARNVLDALSAPRKRDHALYTSALYLDDSQVVALSVRKCWTDEHDAGVHVKVRRAGMPGWIEGWD